MHGSNGNFISNTPRGDDAEHKSGIIIGLKTAAVIAVGSAALFLAGCGNNNAGAESLRSTTTIEDTGTGTPSTLETNTTNQETTTPAETGTTIEQSGEITVESLKIDASLFNDPEKLLQIYIDRENEWKRAGSTPENAVAAMAAPGTMENYAVKLGEKYNPIFIEALLPADWQSKPDLVEYVNRAEAERASVEGMYFATSFPKDEPADIEPYQVVQVVDSIDSVSVVNADTVRISFTNHRTDNSAKNRVGEGLNNGQTGETAPYSPTITFTVEDDRVVLSDIVFGILGQ